MTSYIPVQRALIKCRPISKCNNKLLNNFQSRRWYSIFRDYNNFFYDLNTTIDVSFNRIS